MSTEPSYLINPPKSRKGRHLQDESIETQPNHHFPTDSIAAGLWFSCHKTIYEITSSRLILRPFESGDVEAAFAWFGDPIVMRFTPTGPDASSQVRLSPG